MAEQIQPEIPINPNVRVMVMIGTIGVFGSVDNGRVQSLPIRAIVEGMTAPDESIQVHQRASTEAYLVDWRLCGTGLVEAQQYVATQTLALVSLAGLAGLEIKEIRATDTASLAGHDPNAAWELMETLPNPDELDAIRLLTIEDFTQN